MALSQAELRIEQMRRDGTCVTSPCWQKIGSTAVNAVPILVDAQEPSKVEVSPSLEFELTPDD